MHNYTFDTDFITPWTDENALISNSCDSEMAPLIWLRNIPLEGHDTVYVVAKL